MELNLSPLSAYWREEMKLRVSEDELYPIYDIGDGFGKEVEVSEVFYKGYTEIMDKFWIMQEALRLLYDSVPDEKSPYAFCNMPEFTCDEVEKDEFDERGLMIFKVKDRYNFSWEDKI
jgi:hypothetical protein